MTKSKKHRLQRAEINFVSSLDIAQVASEIDNLADKHIKVETDNPDADRVQFRMIYHRDGKATAVVAGVLRRWAGDMTHVICDGDVSKPKQNVIQRFMGLSLMWRIFLLLMVPLMLMYVTNALALLEVTRVLLIWLLIMVPATLFMLSGLSFMYLIYPNAPLFQRRKKKASFIKDRDKLLQRIIDVLAPHHESNQTEAISHSDDQPELTLRELVRLTYETGAATATTLNEPAHLKQMNKES